MEVSKVCLFPSPCPDDSPECHFLRPHPDVIKTSAIDCYIVYLLCFDCLLTTKVVVIFVASDNILPISPDRVLIRALRARFFAIFVTGSWLEKVLLGEI